MARKTAGPSERGRVPIGELIDVERLERGGRPLTPRRIREALPRGWALADDHEHAYRDRRLLFREGWILMLGLVLFGVLGGLFLSTALPRGWSGVVRVVVLLGIAIFLGGIAGPLVTRALHRR